MAAAPQQSGQSDNATGILWGVAALFAAIGVIWYVFKVQLVHAYFAVKLFEINLISYFTHNLDDLRVTILTANPATLTFQDVVRVGTLVGDYLRYPFVVTLIIMAFVVYFTNSTRVFKRIYTMRDLVELEKTNWPQITPVAKLDLINTDINKGPWAMALSPIQFCKRYHLVEERKRQRTEGMTRKEAARIEAVLKRGEANKVFAVQLGPLWPGIHRLPLHVKALFAVFAARINNDTKAAADLLAYIAASADSKLDFTGTEALLKKHENTKLVQQIIQPHAYLLTVMASMLERARDDGVQASADFLWLKPVDRRLWYMLNVVGRQTPFVEVAGPYAHWLAEKTLGKKIIVPMVEEATNALEIALKEIIYQPDEVEGEQ